MKKVIFSIFCFVFYIFAIKAQCDEPVVGSITVSAPGEITLLIVNASTQPGEGVLGEVAYNTNGTGPIDQYSGLIRGTYVNSTTWEVVIPNLPVDPSVYIEVQAACCSDFDNCSTTGFDFSGFGMGQVVDLPVTWQSLTLTPQSKGHVLDFATATESNNHYFEVQRSTDAKNWQKLGTVNGAGTTDAAQHYTFVDESPAVGFNAYRIKQVDYDGSYSYSSIVNGVWQAKAAQVHMYPNPAQERVFVQGVSAETNLQLIDSQGRIVRSQAWSRAGLDLSGLPAGIYQLQLLSENGVSLSEQLVIQ